MADLVRYVVAVMGRLMDASGWLEILLHCSVRAAVASVWAPVFANVVQDTSFNKGRDEIDDFLGQILHESAGLTQLTECLDYSAERLIQVWPSRFKSLGDARPYAYNPEALANHVYGGRMGNNKHGDGWKFRGRGPIQLTGRDNYAAVGDMVGQDLTVMPELMEQPHYVLEAAIAWWEDRIPDAMIGDPEKVTRRVNGGLIGLNDRRYRTSLAEKALEA